jgi:hypothetical protein
LPGVYLCLSVSIFIGVQAIKCVRKLKTTGLPSGNTVALSAAIRALGPYASPSSEHRESCTRTHTHTLAMHACMHMHKTLHCTVRVRAEAVRGECLLCWLTSYASGGGVKALQGTLASCARA